MDYEVTSISRLNDLPRQLRWRCYLKPLGGDMTTVMFVEFWTDKCPVKLGQTVYIKVEVKI